MRIKKVPAFVLLLSLAFAEGLFDNLQAEIASAHSRPNPVFSGGRRRPGKGGALEVFRNNLDIFVGPALQSASGLYLEKLTEDLKSGPSKNFLPPKSGVTNEFLTVFGGVQFRLLPGARDKGISNLISYAAGISYIRRGYSYETEIGLKNGNPDVVNFINIENKVRANYISVPLSIHFGRRVFVEAGVSLDFLVFGRANYTQETTIDYYGLKPENSGVIMDPKLRPFVYSKKEFGLSQVIPFVSPGYTLSAGYFFNEYVGIRVGGNFNPALFRQNSNPANLNINSTLLSVQVLGCLNK